VAFLPAVFELTGLDVGGAGAFGFAEAKGNLKTPLCEDFGESKMIELHEFRFIEGDHGAAIGEKCWSQIARFAVGGEAPSPDTETSPDTVELVKRSWITSLVYFCAPAITIPGAFLVAALLASPWLAVVITTGAEVQSRQSIGPEIRSLLAVSAGLIIAWGVGRIMRSW